MKTKLAMIEASSRALDFKNQKPDALDEEIIQVIVKNLKLNEKTKLASIAAISRSLRYKNQGHDDKQIMQRIMNESEEILESVN